MAGIADVLGIGRSALGTHQRAVSVLSHNIANVNTPGYTRQEAVYRAVDPAEGSIGNGVEIQTVRRVVDRFLELQIISEKATLARRGVEKGMLDRVEAVFNDTTNEGIHNAIGEFFSAAQDLANNPSDAAARIVFMERGDRLAERIRAADQSFKTLRHDADTEIRGRVLEVNAAAQRIADLNKQIRLVEGGGQGASDLRDERTRILNELSEMMDIHVINTEGRDTDILIGRGGSTAPLVMGDRAYALSVVNDPDNGHRARILAGTEGTINITETITAGKIGGLLQFRDRQMPNIITQLDQLAASIINEVNAQHRVGFGLDGSTGNDFFSPLVPVVTPLSTNRGTAVVTAGIAPPPEVDPALDPDQVEPAPSQEPLTLDQYEVSFSAGQPILLNLATGASSDLFDITVTPDGTEVLQVTFEGMQVTIEGEMKDGDRVKINFYEGSAGTMAKVVFDKNKIAAAASAEGLPGNNANVLALAQLQDKAVFSLKGETFQGFYGSFVAEIGVQTQQAEMNLSVEEIAQERLNTMREEISGVSLDEEMTRLIQFQRAYQASARLVTTADTLLETVIGLKR